MAAEDLEVKINIDTRPFQDAIRSLIVDLDTLRIYDLVGAHNKECSKCYMDVGMIPTEWSRRWVSRTYIRIVGNPNARKRPLLCEYGRYLQMAKLRTATR
jgi:hypothetical protein